MVLGLRPSHSPYINFLMNLVDNKLAGNSQKAPTKSSKSPTLTSWALFCSPTPVPISVLALAPVVGRYTDKNL